TKQEIVHKGKHNYITLNKNPYTRKTHFLIIPYEHIKHLHALPNEALQESQQLTYVICTKLHNDCYEIGINYNIGHDASASIPDHLHQHVICDEEPRYYNLITAMENTQEPIDESL